MEMNPQELASSLFTLFNYWVTLVGSISIILKGLEKLAGLTKSKKDDIRIAKLRKAVDIILATLHELALSPKNKKDL